MPGNIIRHIFEHQSLIYTAHNPKAYSSDCQNRRRENDEPRKNAQNPTPTPPPDQRPRQCHGMNCVGGQIANPFTAKHVTKATTILPNGTRKVTEMVEFVARDSDGRIRFEKHGVFRPAGDAERFVLHTRDGGQIETTRETMGISILILDCPDSAMIQIQPGMQIAHVTK
jgi:hypothetical protein